MKEYVNLLFSIIDKINEWELKNNQKRKDIFINYLDLGSYQFFQF